MSCPTRRFQLPTDTSFLLLAMMGNSTGCALWPVVRISPWTRASRRIRHVSRIVACLIPQLAALISMHSTDHWLQVLRVANVPCAPINTLDRVFEDPQVKHRNMCVNVAHPTGVELRLVASPIKFSATTVGERLKRRRCSDGIPTKFYRSF
ncbi:CoA transferase [Bradyrhizobium japonicum]|uniref:CoA transferase n=1 Tax=Bradyrhizobium japonicum TaxID=375 RepID=UPI0034D22F83